MTLILHTLIFVAYQYCLVNFSHLSLTDLYRDLKKKKKKKKKRKTTTDKCEKGKQQH